MKPTRFLVSHALCKEWARLDDAKEGINMLLLEGEFRMSSAAASLQLNVLKSNQGLYAWRSHPP